MFIELHDTCVTLTKYGSDECRLFNGSSNEGFRVPKSSDVRAFSVILREGDQFLTPAGRWEVQWDDERGTLLHSMRPPPLPVPPEDLQPITPIKPISSRAEDWVLAESLVRTEHERHEDEDGGGSENTEQVSVASDTKQDRAEEGTDGPMKPGTTDTGPETPSRESVARHVSEGLPDDTERAARVSVGPSRSPVPSPASAGPDLGLKTNTPSHPTEVIAEVSPLTTAETPVEDSDATPATTPDTPATDITDAVTRKEVEDSLPAEVEGFTEATAAPAPKIDPKGGTRDQGDPEGGASEEQAAPRTPTVTTNEQQACIVEEELDPATPARIQSKRRTSTKGRSRSNKRRKLGSEISTPNLGTTSAAAPLQVEEEEDVIIVTPAVANTSRHRRSTTISPPDGNFTAADAEWPMVYMASNTTIDTKLHVMQSFKQLGGRFTKNIVEADILCLPDSPLKRTGSLLLSICLGKDVVTEAWIVEAHRRLKFPSITKYRPNDRQTELEWGFRLDMALERGRRGLTHILEGRKVYMTKSLKESLNNKLSKDLSEVAIALGAEQFKRHIPSKREANECEDLSTMVVLGNESDPQASNVVGMGLNLYSRDALTMAVLRGQLDLGDFVLATAVKEEPE